jgi:RecA/RadA recombinase
MFGKNSINKELAYFIGVVIADGTLERTRIQVTNDDPYIKALVRSVGSLVLKVPNEYDNNGKGSIGFHFSIKEKVEEFYNKWGLSEGVAKDKQFSKQIRKFDRESLKAVIRGYVECEGYFGPNEIEVTSASFELMRQFKIILQGFGIKSSLNKKFVEAYPDNDYYRVVMSGENAVKYIKIIGVESPLRQSETEEILSNLERTALDYIPHCRSLIRDLYESTDFTTRDHAELANHVIFGGEIRELTRNNLNKILAGKWENTLVLQRLQEIAKADYLYDQIESVDYEGEEPTFDFSLPETHSFVANGFITHNTTLCAQVAAEAQARGGVVITIDTEERIDVDYWTDLGVDCDRVLRVEAHTLEEVFNKQESILRHLVTTAPETVGVMIYDSLGSTSSDEIITFNPKDKETFMDKAKQAFGRDAKTIGLGLKGLNGLISRSNMCYMYTNHIYTRMNAGHGDPYETYGGLKAKFMATVRLRLQRIGSVTEEDDTDNKLTTGIRVRVKALKNSMAPHLTERESVLLGGKGFSNDYTVFEMGKKLGVIEGSGSWSTANIAGEEVKFQGWNGFMDKVVTHPKYAELLKQVAEAL